jgi:hypothetical protein
LAQLDDPTPIGLQITLLSSPVSTSADIDPENEDFAGKYDDDDPDGPEEDSLNGRAHYLNVECANVSSIA